jgi:hypothetical protein
MSSSNAHPCMHLWRFPCICLLSELVMAVIALEMDCFHILGEQASRRTFCPGTTVSG